VSGIDGTCGGVRTGHGRIDDIEVLRAFAIGLVLVEHTRLDLLPWVSGEREWLYTHFGFWSGVDLFLAISGFVIARSLLPLLAEARNASDFFNISLSFWVRRAWRLLPSAWLWLAIILLGVVAFNRSGAFQPVHATVHSVVAGALQYANVRAIYVFGRGYVGAAGHYWSLSLEEQFYLLFPFVVFLARRRLPLVLAAIALAQLFLYRNGPHASVPMNMLKSDALSLGVLLAIWTGQASYRRLEPTALEGRLVRFVLPPAFLVLYSALTGAAWGPPAWRVGGAALLAAAVVWLASYDRDCLFPPGAVKRFFCWMGARSYGLYLIHVPAFYAAREIWFRVDPHYQDASLQHALILAATGFALLVISAELNFRLVEAPLRRRGARIAGSIRQRYVAVTTPAAPRRAPGIDDEAQVRA
jgi:peptidoglycan/LPS O-acetylase OafA/YrhL